MNNSIQDKSESPNFNYAGFWIRVGATVIDITLLLVAESILSFVITVFIFTFFYADALVIEVVIRILMIINLYVYFAILESSKWQATLGKRAVGIIVTDEFGKRISLGHAFGRNIAKILSALILYVGYMMVGWTQKKQGLHDIAAGTLVVYKDSFNSEG